MIRTRMAGTKVFVAGLAVAAIAAGSAAAAMPSIWLRVHARLAPVAGTTAAGSFNGVLVKNGGGGPQPRPSAVPRTGNHWQLTWRLSLPTLSGPAAASLRIHGAQGAAPVVRILCASCAAQAKGTMKLTGGQALRIANSQAVVVVQARSATLRGTVKVSARIVPVATRG